METESEPKAKLIKVETNVNPNEDSLNSDINLNQCGQYSKDSFDRFGDDLCELLISYLTFKEKIVFENVCKQWKRCVYNKQRVLRVFSVHPIDAIPHLTNVYLNDLLVPIVVKDFVSGYANNMNMRTINKTALKSLLTKCKYIKKIEFTRCFVDSALLDMIGTYCSHLESIQLDLIGLQENDLISFGQKYGKRLTHIKFNNRSFSRDYVNKFCNEFGKKLLLYCLNIKSFTCEDISAIADPNESFLPKLENIDLRLRPNDGSNFSHLVNKYEHRMKKLKIYSHEIDVQNLRNTLSQIARFRAIEDLNLSFYVFSNNSNNNTINDKVIEMSKNCTKLKRLVFNINTALNGNELINGNIFDCFGKFINLKHLYVWFRIKDIKETVDCFKRLTRLTHLTIHCPCVDDSFFKDIDRYIPNLISLTVSTDMDLTDVIMDSISKLRNLSKLVIGNCLRATKYVTDSGVTKLINSCDNLRDIKFYSRPNITTVTIDNLIALALKKWKSNISFYCGFSRSGDEADFPPIDLNSFKTMPTNLKITIRTGPIINNPIVFPEFGPPGVHVHIQEINHNMMPPPLPIHIQEIQQILVQQQGFVQNLLNNI